MCIAFYGNPSQSYGASLAIWDHTVLPVTRHKWTRPAITPARQTGTRFTNPGGMEGWVDLGSLIVARRGIEPTALDRKSDVLTITPPNHSKRPSLSSLITSPDFRNVRRASKYFDMIRCDVESLTSTGESRHGRIGLPPHWPKVRAGRGCVKQSASDTGASYPGNSMWCCYRLRMCIF